MEDIAVDVVHIPRETFDKFQELGADEVFRQAVIAEGFSIHLNFGDGVEVWHGNTTEGTLVSAKGATLAEALWNLFLDHPRVGSGKLHEAVTRRFQTECPHDGEFHFRSHGAFKCCSRCHAFLD